MENSYKQDPEHKTQLEGSLGSNNHDIDHQQPLKKKQKVESTVMEEKIGGGRTLADEFCIIPECDAQPGPGKLIEHLERVHKIEKKKESETEDIGNESSDYYKESRLVMNSRKKNDRIFSEEDQDQQIDQELFEKLLRKVFSMDNTSKEIEIIYKMFLQKVLVNSYNECKRLYEEEKSSNKNSEDKTPDIIEEAFRAVEKEYNDKYDSVSAKYLTSHSKESISYQIKLQLMMGYLDNLYKLAKFEEKYKLSMKFLDAGKADIEEKYKEDYEKLQRKFLWSNEVSQLLQKDLDLLTKIYDDLLLKKEKLLDANLQVEIGNHLQSFLDV